MELQKIKKYIRIDEVSQEEIDALILRVNSCSWRQTFHIQPISGLLNDPNGFCFYNGEYHLFYQWHPLGPFHGLKYWYHTKSKDLVNWENVGIAIKPDNYFDSHGAYSGSAIEHDGNVFLFYTGNTRDENFKRNPHQCIAVMDATGTITKLEKSVFDKVPAGYTEHFRDPKVWKDGEKFYAVIGAQKTDEIGCVVLLSSSDLLEWNFEGELATHLNHFGYMWECPDYFEIENQGVLIFSPQGLEPEGDSYQNIFQSGYVLGEKLDLQQKEMNHGNFEEIDRGFDFYAPHTMMDPQGRRIMVAWMGLPEVEYPSDINGWAHCLTLPRELSVQNGKLRQKPVQELQSLRKMKAEAADSLTDEKKIYDWISGVTYELVCEFERGDAAEYGIEFRAGDDEKTVIKYDAVQGKVVLDRALSGKEVGGKFGTERKCEFSGEKIKFQLFVDSSSVEIFVNDGEEVFTSRIFPDVKSREIRFFATGGSAAFKAVKWDY
ncbi:sucrose-6-phosphate hydrolase [Planomicrobium sp. CPCC 101110]|uniref:glycoside hydrolase family 32 protein n=1 Tax=Planomicrobium sp. CPCC 101110 TaxID=2599619 RepID=UPI0011B36DC9|nr:sucrose-6-phosphate hydrolase [Planomicrobium sp. CPCC 101110]TWT26044.1 sucrose-6-phosphate hydrolase [Planomicrobium sp. CPCC 101110]